MSAHRWVRRVWAGQGGAAASLVRTVLVPAEMLFRLGVHLRGRRYAPGSPRVRRASIPVVSVGNLSVGGTGKTPVASWILRFLRDQGAAPALVARGYGEDELLLHGRWTPDVPVVADPDRHAGVERAAQGGADVAVLDDGFQHRRLARDVDLVLVAAEEGLPGALLPRGPFREPAAALARAHGVLITRKEAPAEQARALADRIRAEWPEMRVGLVHLRPRGFGALEDAAPVAPPDEPVVLVSAVARPESVMEAVKGMGIQVAAEVAFSDHHAFTDAEVARVVREAGGRSLVVTEKDAVKLRELPAARSTDVRVLLQELVVEEGLEELEALVSGAWRGNAA